MDNPSSSDIRLTNKSLSERQPDENASLDEWREWALSLNARHKQMLETEKQRRKTLKTYREELTRKNKVFEYYKKRIADLESQIPEKSLWERIRQFFNRKQVS
jgi:predicted  nucleic acid-binding Zn-ribbon protein